MTYQPPLIGTKQLLNFTATSWPALGAVCLGVAFALGVAGAGDRQALGAPVLGKRAVAAQAVAGGRVCGMRRRAPIADIGNAVRLLPHDRSATRDSAGSSITRKGKVYAFDSIECLASFYLQQPATARRALGVGCRLRQPGHWIPATNALYARSEAHQSPMGLNLVSFSVDRGRRRCRARSVARRRWPDVLARSARVGRQTAVRRRCDALTQCSRMPNVALAVASALVASPTASSALVAQSESIVSPTGAVRTVARGGAR